MPNYSCRVNYDKNTKKILVSNEDDKYKGNKIEQGIEFNSSSDFDNYLKYNCINENNISYGGGGGMLIGFLIFILLIILIAGSVMMMNRNKKEGVALGVPLEGQNVFGKLSKKDLKNMFSLK